MNRCVLGPCGRLSWKWRPKGANGPAGGCSNDCRRKPTGSAVFPPRAGERLRSRQYRRRTLRSLAGAVELKLSYGRDPRDGRWGCPLLEAWGVRPHQEFTPAARRRLAFTVSASGTDAEAAELAPAWGLAVADSTLHALGRHAGARAEAQTARRVAAPAPNGNRSAPRADWPCS